jgi:hypothetical protein
MTLHSIMFYGSEPILVTKWGLVNNSHSPRAQCVDTTKGEQ